MSRTSRCFGPRSALSALLLLASATAALGCARGPDVEASGLALRRVVIYRNGVAYYERQGLVDVDEVTFRVRKEKVGDFLATLAVIEAGGSSVHSASFPVELAEPGDAASRDSSARRLDFLVKPLLPAEPSAPKKDALETVKLTLDGRDHDLVVGYVAETPVWRPSYRLVMGKGQAGGSKPAKLAHLQAWGIVQNLSGEDWNGVRLSLVAGAPLAFQATLERPAIPLRPVVTDQGEVIASVPTSETTLGAHAPEAPPPAEAAEEEDDEDDSGESLRAMEKGVGPGAGWGGAGGSAPRRSSRARAPMPPPAPEPSAAPMARAEAGSYAPRNMSALAAVALEGGTTRYDLPFLVDVPDRSATMVLLLAKEVPGESIFLFAPDGGVPASSAHPFRVARFTNDTAGLLERGPIAVYENGAFLGQGMVEPLPPGATTTVPFALERSLAVATSRTENQEGARVAKIEAGELEIERDWVTHTKYAIKNGSAEDARTLIKHPRLYDTRLHAPPQGTEDNLGTGSALVPVLVPKHGTFVLDVDERRIFRRQVEWLSPMADEAVRAYLADARADAAVVRALGQAWELRDKLKKATDERDGLAREKSELERQSEETRRNLRAIEKNKSAEALRKDLTERLARAAARLDEITKRVIVLEMQIGEQQIRFRDLVNPIKMVSPPSPVKAG